MIILNLIYTILIFIFGLLIAYKTKKTIKSNIIYFVLIEHMIFSYFYYLFTLYNISDARGYFIRATYNNNWLATFNVGTDFIDFVATIPIKYLNFSYLNAHLLFGLFGFIGFTYFIKMLKNNGKNLFGIPLTIIIVLLPGFHFWTSALGKDSLFFMALMMFIYSLRYVKQNKIKLLFSFFLIIMIRPHMAMVIILATLLTLIIVNPKKINLSHIFLLTISIIVFILFIPLFNKFVGIDELSTESIQQKIEIFNNEGKRGGGLTSNIDVSGYSLPAKLFAYLFRPFFFDARSVFQYIASFENLFLLLIIIQSTINKYKHKKIHNKQYINKFLLYYILLSWLMLSINMYNLGLASRQKYMIIPAIFLLLFDNPTKQFIKKKL